LYSESWNRQLLREEGCSNFFTELGKFNKVVPSNLEVFEDNAESVASDHYPAQFNAGPQQQEHLEPIDVDLKLFVDPALSDGGCPPLERTLTPGFGDPTYFAGSALAGINILRGDSQGIEKRCRVARANTNFVLKTSPRKQSSTKTTRSQGYDKQQATLRDNQSNP
jgi:hypothetical protein